MITTQTVPTPPVSERTRHLLASATGSGAETALAAKAGSSLGTLPASPTGSGAGTVAAQATASGAGALLASPTGSRTRTTGSRHGARRHRATGTSAPAPSTLLTADNFERSFPPPESLRPWFTEMGRIPTLLGPLPNFTHVPRATTTIVLRTEPTGRRDALVIGPHTRASYAVAKRPAGCLRLRLAPGAVQPLLGVSAADLADKVMRVSDVPGLAAGLAAELNDLDLDRVLPYLESVLPQHIPTDHKRRDNQRLLESAVKALSTSTGSIADLAAALSVSERHLRNLFAEGIGVSPKHFARITRIRQVLAAAGNTPWSDLALTTGFYDQSHMTADFRAIMGVPPAAFFQGTRPAATGCPSLS